MTFNLVRKVQSARAVKAEAVARARFGIARARYLDAVARRDSRDKHATSARLTEAATALLKAEMRSRELSRSTSARTPKSARPIAALTFQGRG